jgi:hypothetical protein
MHCHRYFRSAARWMVGFLPFVVVTAAPLLGLRAYLRHVNRNVEDWCYSVAVGASVDAMTASARKKNFFAYQGTDSSRDGRRFFASDGWLLIRYVCQIGVVDSAATDERSVTALD